jgi:copper(I)-binding protein
MQRAKALLLLTLVVLVAACSGGAAASATPSTSGVQLTVKDAWARAAVAGGDTAVYFTIVNGPVADTLTGVTTDAAQSAGLHQTSTDASEMTGMQMMTTVPVPGGGTVSFAPGGYHVMLTGLKQALNAGDHVQVTLTFQNAGSVNVTAEVRAS